MNDTMRPPKEPTVNDDKIKVLEKAVQYIKNNDNYTGICDGLNSGRYELDLDGQFREPSLYGIELPPKVYYTSDGEYQVFSYPCTAEGKQQRIEVLQEAINRLKTMTQDERRQVINKIIISTFKGVKMDAIYFNDRFEALNKLSDEELLNQNSELN